MLPEQTGRNGLPGNGTECRERGGWIYAGITGGRLEARAARASMADAARDSRSADYRS